MPNNPRSNGEKMQKMLNAWETLASAKSFGGMTLEQFRTAAAPAQAARQRIADLESQMTQAINERDAADATFNAKAQLVWSSTASSPIQPKALTAACMRRWATRARVNVAPD